MADRLMIERLRFHCGTASASEATMPGPWSGGWLGSYGGPSAQSGGRGSNTTEIRAGLDRSTALLGAALSVSRRPSASRMTRPQRPGERDQILTQAVDVL